MDNIERGVDKLFFGFLKEAKLYITFRKDRSLKAEYYNFKKTLLKDKNIGTPFGLAPMFNRVYLYKMPFSIDNKRIYYSQLFRFYLLKHADYVGEILGKSKLTVITDLIRVIKKNIMNPKIRKILEYYEKNNKVKIEENYEYYIGED